MELLRTTRTRQAVGAETLNSYVTQEHEIFEQDYGQAFQWYQKAAEQVKCGTATNNQNSLSGGR